MRPTTNNAERRQGILPHEYNIEESDSVAMSSMQTHQVAGSDRQARLGDFQMPKLLVLLVMWSVSVPLAKEGQEAQTILKSAVAVWHLGDIKSTKGDRSLTAHGEVRLGQPLSGIEREESLNRGSGGQVAAFQGGWLSEPRPKHHRWMK
jgi:hypothetical protein